MILKGKRLAAPGMVKPILLGASICLGINVGMSMLLAMMMNTEKIADAGMGYGVMVTLMMGAYWGSYAACKMRKEQRLPTAMLTGGIYFVMLLFVNVLFYGAKFQGIGETVLLILCGCMLAAMWTSRKSGTGKMKKFKFSNG